MRTGPIDNEEVVLEEGQPFVLTAASVMGDATRVSTTVEDLPSLVHPGDEIFLADGAIVLRVTKVDTDVTTEVIRRGVLRSRKGLHVPLAERHIQAFTPADELAMATALRLKADFIGLSFVRDVQDIHRARAALPKRGNRPSIVAKIETSTALDSLHEIAKEADAVIVARGDLGIQMRMERLPFLQKEIIKACNAVGTPVVTATQMLESMTRSPLPTRAEVTDIANAVLDGSDALMLSEETAIGDNPSAAVRVMASIAKTAEEAWTGQEHKVTMELAGQQDPVSWAVAHAAVQAAHDLDVAAILCPTHSGATARKVASFRPQMPLVALSSRDEVLSALTLTWGTIPLRVAHSTETSEEVNNAVRTTREAKLIESGQLIAIVAGTPGPRAGGTDFVRIVRVP